MTSTLTCGGIASRSCGLDERAQVRIWPGMVERPPRTPAATGFAGKVIGHVPVVLQFVEIASDRGAAYRAPDRTDGKKLSTTVIDKIKAAVPHGLDELAQRGRTLHRRRDDILVWFDHPGSSSRPRRQFNGRLEHLRASPRVRDLINYRLRSLLEAGGFRPLIHFLS